MNLSLFRVFILSAAAVSVACAADKSPTLEVTAAVKENPAVPATELEKTLYAMGVIMAGSVTEFALTEKELEMFQQGFKDAANGRNQEINPDQYRQQIQELARQRQEAMAAAEKALSDEFLAKLAAEEGTITTDSGLVYTEVQAGSGPQPVTSDQVRVHYHGTLRDGTVFDSSVERGEPITFGLDKVIPCWTEGVQKIKVGGKSRLVCPSDLAYGDRGSPPRIKPGATLIFDVELFEINPDS